MKRINKIYNIYKSSSKQTAKRVRGINFDYANRAMPGSKEDVIRYTKEHPTYSESSIKAIEEIQIEPDFAKRLNAEELVFIELGAYLTSSLEDMSELKDYLFLNLNIKKPGDLSEKISSLYKYLYKMGYKKEALDLLNVIKWEIK